MDHRVYQCRNKQNFLPPHQQYRNKKQSRKRKRVKSSNVKLPVKRLSVQYAHACVSRSLHQAKVDHVLKTHGKDVVRICSRTIAQLQSTNAILKELLQHKYIEEIGMPLIYAYKMKSLVLFIKPFDANCSEKIESKFRNSGLNFHITVFDVKNPYQKSKNLSKTPDDEPKIKQLEAKPTTKVVEEVQQIEESQNVRQQDKFPLWEVLTTLLLSMASGFAIFFIQIVAKK